MELREGLTLFAENRALLHLVLIVFATGFGLGVYLVGMPLIAKQFYGGGAVICHSADYFYPVISVNLGVMNRAQVFKRRVD